MQDLAVRFEVVCGPTGLAARPGLQSESNFRFRCYRIPYFDELLAQHSRVRRFLPGLARVAQLAPRRPLSPC